MRKSKLEIKEFRRELIRRIKQDGGEFRFSAVVEEAGVDPQQARRVAESLFARFFASVVDDGEIAELGKRFDLSKDAVEFIASGKTANEFKEFIMERNANAEPIKGEPEIGMSDNERTEYSLTRAIRNAADGKLVWRGSAEQTLSSRQGTPEQRAGSMRELVTRVLSQYPPR